MKIIFSFILSLFLLAFAFTDLYAQSGRLTIILLRHAEKDLTVKTNPNPELSAAGKQRAELLIKTIGKYKPDLIYSTNYKRTRATVLPLAEKIDSRYRIPIRAYNFDKLEEFAAELLNSKARTIVVVGHNTTTPEMANLLVRQEKYKPLDDDEYDKIWIVEIKRNKRKPSKVREKVIRY